MTQKTMRPELSIVSPCYNEEEGIIIFYQALSDVLKTITLTYEIIFVDDGSKDSTLTVLNQIAQQNEHVVVLSLTRNFGHQFALTAGLDQARGQAVLVMDSDLQHPPSLIPDMLQIFETGVDIVYAIREDTEEIGFFKRVTSQWFYKLSNLFGGSAFIPGSADFRLMSFRAVQAMRQMREKHRFLRGMSVWTGFPYKTITFRVAPRIAGRSKYTWRKMLRLAMHGIFSFSVLPLRMVTMLGFFVTGLGCMYLFYVLIGFLLWPSYLQPGWASILVSLLILSGVQLLSYHLNNRGKSLRCSKSHSSSTCALVP